jgi:hypothetical protein
MVKTAVYHVAHTQSLDPSLAVLLCILGNDSLKVFFGWSRTVGGHKPNFAVDEASYRFASCVRLSKLFLNHPDWERKPRHLKLNRNWDFDHLTPHSWIGELGAQSCNLSSCWSGG